MALTSPRHRYQHHEKERLEVFVRVLSVNYHHTNSFAIKPFLCGIAVYMDFLRSNASAGVET